MTPSGHIDSPFLFSLLSTLNLACFLAFLLHTVAGFNFQCAMFRLYIYFLFPLYSKRFRIPDFLFSSVSFVFHSSRAIILSWSILCVTKNHVALTAKLGYRFGFQG